MVKTPGSSVTRKGVHWGQTQLWVNIDPEFGQLAAEYDSKMGHSDLKSVMFCRKLTKFRVTFNREVFFLSVYRR